MILKTYRARTMGDALAEVKKDLGKEAVILHTRTYKVGGWLGFGGKPMVEITASDAVNVLSRERKRPEAVPQPSRGSGRREASPTGPAVPAEAVARAYGATPPSGSGSQAVELLQVA